MGSGSPTLCRTTHDASARTGSAASAASGCASSSCPGCRWSPSPVIRRVLCDHPRAARNPCWVVGSAPSRELSTTISSSNCLARCSSSSGSRLTTDRPAVRHRFSDAEVAPFDDRVVHVAVDQGLARLRAPSVGVPVNAAAHWASKTTGRPGGLRQTVFPAPSQPTRICEDWNRVPRRSYPLLPAPRRG